MAGLSQNFGAAGEDSKGAVTVQARFGAVQPRCEISLEDVAFLRRTLKEDGGACNLVQENTAKVMLCLRALEDMGEHELALDFLRTPDFIPNLAPRVERQAMQDLLEKINLTAEELVSVMRVEETFNAMRQGFIDFIKTRCPEDRINVFTFADMDSTQEMIRIDPGFFMSVLKDCRNAEACEGILGRSHRGDTLFLNLRGAGTEAPYSSEYNLGMRYQIAAIYASKNPSPQSAFLNRPMVYLESSMLFEAIERAESAKAQLHPVPR